MPAIDALPAAPPAIIVVGSRQEAEHTPNTKESVDAAQLRTTTNVRNTEDALRYLPSLFVRKRHIGDTQAPLATRTSGVGASARSLVYADGVLLSALIGNNNNFASPRWGMVSPEEIDHVDVLYGPFSAAYPGNSIGAVVNITTRMPDKLEASATAAWNLQKFDQYETHGGYPAYQLSGTVGDRMGPLSWFLSANHVDSKSQPLAYVTVNQAAVSTSGTSVTGAFSDVNRTGTPIFEIGAGGFEHQKQDNLKAKLRLDLPSDLRLTWQIGLFLNDTASHAETYLADAGGSPVYAGALNISGQKVTVPASAFSNQVYHLDERHWMHSATLEQSDKTFSWWLIGSLYNYARDDQRIPSTALPGAATVGAGSIVRMKGTRWRTLDLHAYERLAGPHQLHGGAHYDDFTLRSRRYATTDWRIGSPGALSQESLGHSRTLAVWGEDEWALAPAAMLTVGARYEWWKAYAGRIFPLAAPASPDQPSRTAQGVSPKASLKWHPPGPWSVTLSAGRALRFPTVSELYQSVSVGGQQRSPDPNLKPEKAWSSELAVERHIGTEGRVRLSLFHESIRDALISQSALYPGTQTAVSFVQNIDRTRTNGAELVVEKRNLLPRLDLRGSVTFADPKIVSDAAFPSAEGKLIPQVPRRKATLVATWRPDDRLSLTAAARYSSRLYGTINNADFVGHTYQGFEGYFVADARVVYRVTAQIDVSAGVENLTDKRYFLFHPFPGRTFTAELHWHL
jgi:iron complex outermembrane receptor protein